MADTRMSAMLSRFSGGPEDSVVEVVEVLKVVEVVEMVEVVGNPACSDQSRHTTGSSSAGWRSCAQLTRPSQKYSRLIC